MGLRSVVRRRGREDRLSTIAVTSSQRSWGSVGGTPFRSRAPSAIVSIPAGDHSSPVHSANKSGPFRVKGPFICRAPRHAGCSRIRPFSGRPSRAHFGHIRPSMPRHSQSLHFHFTFCPAGCATSDREPNESRALSRPSDVDQRPVITHKTPALVAAHSSPSVEVPGPTAA